MTTPIKTETFRHTGVKKDGTLENDLGSVETKAWNAISAPKGGCGSPGCDCSPGHWLVIVKARTAKGVVTGKTLYFATRKDLLAYVQEKKIQYKT